jgi:hypothetical protein
MYGSWSPRRRRVLLALLGALALLGCEARGGGDAGPGSPQWCAEASCDLYAECRIGMDERGWEYDPDCVLGCRRCVADGGS